MSLRPHVFISLHHILRSKLVVLVLILICACKPLQAQVSDNTERSLYAETKQVNQFFRRFNNEEAASGVKYNSKDSLYRNTKTRNRYLNMLFNNEDVGMTSDIKKSFISDITNKNKPLFLDFHGGSWFAQVNTTFLWQGKEEKLIIYLKLQEEKVGSKWIISKINFKPFARFAYKDTNTTKNFLHPLSHELDFMNLYKVFEFNKENIASYTSKDYTLDQLSIFLYEVKKGNLQFRTVNNVKFHFFQLNNWYFELSEFNRSGNNKGWLISKLVKANEPEKQILLKYIYDQEE
jgi:hypothetical protein